MSAGSGTGSGASGGGGSGIHWWCKEDTIDEVDATVDRSSESSRHVHDHHPTIVTNWQAYAAWNSESHTPQEQDEYLDALANAVEIKCNLLESRESLRCRFSQLNRAAHSHAT